MPPSEIQSFMQGTSAGNAGGLGTGRMSDTLGRFVNSINGTEANNMFNAQEAEKARIFNSAEAQKTRDWETLMSNTAYQRAAADMKAAGINPASLGGNGAGSAASTPSGATAQGVAASGQKGHGLGILGAVIDGIGMALKAKFMMSAVKNNAEGLNIKKFSAESKKALEAAKIADLEANSSAKAALSAARTRNTGYSADLKKMKIDKIKRKDKYDRALEEARKKEYDRVKNFIHTKWVED